jgi:hypothetical protein
VSALHLHELHERLIEAVDESGERIERCEETAHVHVYDQGGRLIGIATDAYALGGVFVVAIRREP